MIKRKLTKLHNQATQILARYDEYKDSDDIDKRRRATVELDRFLMENRETAVILLISGLSTELNKSKQPKKVAWHKKLFGGSKHAKNNHQIDT